MRKRIISSFVTLFFAVISLPSLAQVSEENAPIILGYKQPLTLNLDDDVSWSIMDEFNKVVESGVGNITDILIENPGNFVINLQSDHNKTHEGCNHSAVPTSVYLKISEVALHFDFSTIKFSSPLKGGSVDETLVYVNYSSISNDNRGLDLKNLKIVGSGVGAEFVGLVDKDRSSIGQNDGVLCFVLKGTIQKDTYITFHFFDINGQIQPFYYLNQIK